MVDGTQCPQGTIVPNSPRPRSFRHETVVLAFIVLLLMIVVGTIVRAW
jgi:hypothetical protein